MLILASASPRRQDLLRSAGISFSVQPADIDEAPLLGEVARNYAHRLAREKASFVARLHPHRFVLGADTIVVVDEIILGKPRDAADAVRMLRMLSGRTHEVITGVSLARPASSGESDQPQLRAENRELRTEIQSTLVAVSELSDDEIHRYVATGEPMDKAGAYAIQGMASRWISRIEGDYSNVVGLPVALVYRMLREAGAI
jgi:septum formation protein